MSVISKEQKLRQKLAILESEFRELLVSGLQKCTDGNPGLFLTQSEAHRRGDVYPRLVWPETIRIEALGAEIEGMRKELGEPIEGSLYSKYKQYCSRTGSNDVGGRKLAIQLLSEIETGIGE